VLFLTFVRYQHTSISNNALPNPTRWDICLLNVQHWLQRLKFEVNRSEQLYSVQPLPSCVQLFRLTSFLLRAFITRITKHSLLVRCVFGQISASNFSKSSVHNPIKIVSELSISEIESITFSLGLLLVSPDTNATSERSFSATKWEKTYVCTTRAYDRKVQKVHRSRTR